MAVSSVRKGRPPVIVGSRRELPYSWFVPFLIQQHISYYDLILDGLVEDLLFEFRKEYTADRDRVEYCADGSYRLLEVRKQRYKHKKRGSQDPSRSAPVTKKKAAKPADIEIIMLDDD